MNWRHPFALAHLTARKPAPAADAPPNAEVAALRARVAELESENQRLEREAKSHDVVVKVLLEEMKRRAGGEPASTSPFAHLAPDYRALPKEAALPSPPRGTRH